MENSTGAVAAGNSNANDLIEILNDDVLKTFDRVCLLLFCTFVHFQFEFKLNNHKEEESDDRTW